jgi:hypothetical protein
LGQGTTYDHEVQCMKFKVIDDLLLHRWNARTMPVGDVDHRLRFALAPGNRPEQQHRIFWACLRMTS